MHKQEIYKIELRTGSGIKVRYTDDRPSCLDGTSEWYGQLKVTNSINPELVVTPTKKLAKHKKSR